MPARWSFSSVLPPFSHEAVEGIRTECYVWKKIVLHLPTTIVFRGRGVKNIKKLYGCYMNRVYNLRCRPLFGTAACRIGCYRGCRCDLFDLRLTYCYPVEHEQLRVSKGIQRRALSEMGAEGVGGDDGSMVGCGSVQRFRRRRRGE